MKELIESGEEFTSVFISSSKMTYGAIMAIKEKGMKIPEDIAVVGFDIHDDYNLMKPGITTIIQPETKIGSAAADFVLKKILKKEEGYNQRLLIDPKLIVRDSSRFVE
jgi:DNA-binding LacI/PurR family transcriptional regulator